jgi:hypothetical protein
VGVQAGSLLEGYYGRVAKNSLIFWCTGTDSQMFRVRLVDKLDGSGLERRSGDFEPA